MRLAWFIEDARQFTGRIRDLVSLGAHGELPVVPPWAVYLHPRLVYHETLMMLAVESTAQEAMTRRTCYRVLGMFR